jgi:hypothetical protein
MLFSVSKYEGNTLLNLLLDLFMKITDLEKIPEDWHAQGNHKAYPQRRFNV